MVYSDSLIQITSDSLIIKDYYFPLVNKQIPFAQIEVVHVLRPQLFNGKYRLWGMALGQVWLAMDFARFNRDAIFVVTIKGKWLKAGFTVENSEAVVGDLQANKIRVEIEG